MEIKMTEIPVRELVNGYQDLKEAGVFGYGGLLDIRPPYQREFVYRDTQREDVIKSVRQNYPLNVMYWVVQPGNKFEVLDGQQRTISICQYCTGGFSVDFRFFHNLSQEEKDQILDYRLMIYLCEGSEKEKLEWFRVVNIAGERLTPQELRNTIYTGPWLADAKLRFSKSGCPAWDIGEDYLKGLPIRQEYLAKVLSWAAAARGWGIEKYMSEYQNHENANELWLYFVNVINWTKTIFPEYRKEMKGVDWGLLYNKYSSVTHDTKLYNARIPSLMEDEDITNKPGIYTYLLSGDEAALNIRRFSNNMKREAYERQDGVCNMCKEEFKIEEMHADHIKPWSMGGQTLPRNCQVLCAQCNRTKSNI